MSGIFERLQFDFDTSKFGDAQYLTPQSLNYLNVAPVMVKDWQIGDIANNVVERPRYYQNPHANNCANLTMSSSGINAIANNVLSIYYLIENVNVANGEIVQSSWLQIANTFAAAQTLIPTLHTSTSTLNNTITVFKSHTDNISGVNANTSIDVNVPNYDMSTGIGNQILPLLHRSDNIANTTTMLGSFTSLFITNEVKSNTEHLYNDYITLNTAYNSNGAILLTHDQVNSIISNVQIFGTELNTRKNHDWNFYKNAREIAMDYSFLMRFTSMGNTQIYLANNYIGTEWLKTNLANTSNTQ